MSQLNISLASSVLQTYKVIAIVGISADEEKPSYKVARYLQEQGYTMVFINPMRVGETILGQICYADLPTAQSQSGHRIEVVDCFRKAEDIPAMIPDAVQVGAKCLWMQLGIENPAAQIEAEKLGLQVVMNLCMKIEHQKLASA